MNELSKQIIDRAKLETKQQQLGQLGKLLYSKCPLTNNKDKLEWTIKYLHEIAEMNYNQQSGALNKGVETNPTNLNRIGAQQIHAFRIALLLQIYDLFMGGINYEKNTKNVLRWSLVFELQANGEYKLVGRTELEPLSKNRYVHTGEKVIRRLQSMDQEVLTAVLNRRYISVYDEQYADKTAFYRITNVLLHAIKESKRINTQIPSEARNERLSKISRRARINSEYSVPEIFSMMCIFYDMETIFRGFLND